MYTIEMKGEPIAWIGNEIRQCLRDIELADETKKKAKDRIEILEADIRTIVKEEERSNKFKTIRDSVIKRNRGLLEELADGTRKGGHGNGKKEGTKSL